MNDASDSSTDSAQAVRDNPDRRRFEIDTPAGIGFATYTREPNNVWRILHTEVPFSVNNKGNGSRLVKGMLDQIRAQGGKVVPLCGFVRGWIARHPDYAGLVTR